LDGTLILKSGLMTGGSSQGGKSGLAERAKRWVFFTLSFNSCIHILFKHCYSI